jgi:hypothetical protein
MFADTDKRPDSVHGITVTAKWCVGGRTPAWDALWLRILAEVLPEVGRSDTGPSESEPREDGHAS